MDDTFITLRQAIALAILCSLFSCSGVYFLTRRKKTPPRGANARERALPVRCGIVLLGQRRPSLRCLRHEGHDGPCDFPLTPRRECRNWRMEVGGAYEECTLEKGHAGNCKMAINPEKQ